MGDKRDLATYESLLHAQKHWARWVELVGRYSKLPNLAKITQLTPGDRVPPAPPKLKNVRRRLRPDVIAQLVAEYEAGAPTTALTTRYSIGKGTVLRLLAEQGIVLRHQSLTSEQLQEAVNLYQQGWSLAKVGTHFGRDASFIHVTFIRHGVPRRDNHGRPR